MSSLPADQPAVQRFTLNARPPVRALAIAAVAEVLGAALLVAWSVWGLPLVVALLGGLLLALGTVLVAAALVLTGRLRTEVLLSADAITVVRSGQRRSVPWNQVREVTLQHPRLHVVAADPADGLVVVSPRGQGDPSFHTLVQAVRRRLDDESGYRELR